MNKKYELLSKLREHLPEYEFTLFNEHDYEDELPYVEFGDVNRYTERLFSNYSSTDEGDNEILIHKFFGYLNSLFDLKNAEIVNFIHVNTMEVLIGCRFGYEIAKKYMSREMYQYFIEKFPYEQYKNYWDTDNYYTEEEYRRILNLPDVDDD